MRVGLSYSRCILDIVEKRVDIEDVLIVITRTDFDPTDDIQWKGIWWGYTLSNGYSYSEWRNYYYDNEEHESLFRDATVKLYQSGKMHQPRQFGAHPPRRSEFWLETVLPSEELEKNTAAKKAWDHFQTLAGLTNVTLDKEYK